MSNPLHWHGRRSLHESRLTEAERSPSILSRSTKVGLTRAVLVAGAFAALEVLCRSGIIPRATMIPPTEIVAALWQILRSGSANADIVFTIANMLAAIALSVVLGFWFGAALHALPRARRVFEPLLSAYYAVPIFIFYPLLIVVFGVGRTALVVMGAIFGIVAMIVNTMIGLDRVPRVIARSAAIMRLGPMRRLLLLRLPAAAPHLVTGIKLAVAYSVIGIVAGEFILATAGIGKRIAFGYQDFDNRTMYGMLLLLLLMVTAVNGALSSWEKRLHRRFGQQ
jgi:NitT/TauT family transport system permease protein